MTETDVNEIVIDEIRAEMARRRMTQTDLADKLGVTRQWVVRHLNGSTPLTLDATARIAEVIDVSIGDLTRPFDG